TPSSETSAVMDPNEPTTAARDMEPTVPAETPRAEAATTEEPANRDERVVNATRWVVFKPSPPNVSISVDGGPLQPYGPDFQGVRVKPGVHRFRFVGAEDCCQDRVVRRRIPSGSRDFELAVRLRYKPARLYLKGPAPPEASVDIVLPGNRKMPGRIREILRIPMSSLRASGRVQISAPGYRTYEGDLQLRAGGSLTEHSFRLERAKETP
ncbi:MAG: hypothetical protein PVI24_15890, partial [Myxococcales bacterium]